VSTSGTTATISWTAPVATNGAPLTGYRFEYKRNTVSTWQRQDVKAVSGSAPATSTVITGLSPRSTYQVRVIAQSQFGNSPAANGGYAVTSLTKR
jgi:hypothetical protein